MAIDQIDISNRSFAEDLVRRVIQIEVAVSRNLAQPDYSGLEELLESPVDATGKASASSVEHWLADLLKSKAQIHKRTGLYKEEFRPSRGGGRGGSFGSGASGGNAPGCGGGGDGGGKRGGRGGRGGVKRPGKQGANANAGADSRAPGAGDNALQGTIGN